MEKSRTERNKVTYFLLCLCVAVDFGGKIQTKEVLFASLISNKALISARQTSWVSGDCNHENIFAGSLERSQYTKVKYETVFREYKKVKSKRS